MKNYIQTQQIDIMQISETHFTMRNYFKFPNYTLYDTPHPDGTAHEGTAILIKNGIKHYLHGHDNIDYLQATSVTVEDWVGPLTTAAIYCPLKYTIKAEKFRHFYATLGHRFLAGGDYNAKHTHWGCEQEIFAEQIFKYQLQPRASGCCFEETGSSFIRWCLVAR